MIASSPHAHPPHAGLSYLIVTPGRPRCYTSPKTRHEATRTNALSSNFPLANVECTAYNFELPAPPVQPALTLPIPRTQFYLRLNTRLSPLLRIARPPPPLLPGPLVLQLGTWRREKFGGWRNSVVRFLVSLSSRSNPRFQSPIFYLPSSYPAFPAAQNRDAAASARPTSKSETGLVGTGNLQQPPPNVKVPNFKWFELRED
ncbi:hypothetical protein B0H17DRAFT_1327738 [Mycena rosella]|uniref:Uncharacterized protein n=1 Tax=Mycena rosella TaxID=1033263 RepID=A0AAD7DXG8_MYCRO|nr:hypothetical protein B0H17DRAFT_1327738 [Mycena rosella]